MSSSTPASATAALTRSRSLRQPGAGLNRAQRKDEAGKDTNNNNAVNKGSAASNSAAPNAARTTSPSRLPKPGASTVATRARSGTVGTSSTTTANPSAAAGTKTRPTSGIYGRSNTVAVRKPLTQSTANDQAEPPIATRPTTIKANRLTRPTSKSVSSSSRPSPTITRPSPTTSSQPQSSETISATTTSPTRTQQPRTSAHIRAKSNATALTSTTVLRPPRPPSAGSIASTSTTTTPATTAATSKRPIGRSNTITTRSTHQRQVSGPTSSANPSGLSRSSTITATRSTTTTRPSAAATATATATADDAPRLRPAFSTHQQHYSPARSLAPKALTSTFLAPPSPSKLPANVAISSETARLQTELLQLHLLHRDADAVAAEWHDSAREKLGRRLAALARARAEVGGGEAEAEEARNLAALAAWGPGGGGKGLEDRIQVLDGVVSGVWGLGEPGGRYARVVRAFEKWADRMVQSVEARRKAGGLGALVEDDKVAFVGELDPAWKDEVAAMTRKLDLWRRQLGELGGDGLSGGGGEGGDEEEVQQQQQQQQEQEQSSLARILSGCRAQVGDMLAELDVMGQIERDAIAQETAWIRRVNRDDDENDTPRAGAIWRAF